MDFETIQYEVNRGIAVLTLNRPQQRNALSVEMRDEMASLVPVIAHDASVKALIITGAGDNFCGGGDISGMRKPVTASTPADGRNTIRDVQAWLPQLVGLEKPVIAAVDGVCFGAGFSLALAADFIICTSRARFCQAFVRVGLVPDFSAIFLLPRIVGLQKAKELMFTGRVVNADEAKSLGIAFEVHEPENLKSAAQDIAGRFRDAPTESIGITKTLLNQSFQSDERLMGELEGFASATVKTLPYHQEAVERFLGKRPPRFDWDRLAFEHKIR
ncbi:MAG TPA: enoyl-CoA hydratase/isomerase family protein [Albitalea sp.]|jgi:2-(1,2-epoxy-1,2-dihydrophenyl)acetyl-CoA isomerase|nr:enoyl-CoA hydratase/isomerase family protein [Albitalea sp.]